MENKSFTLSERISFYSKNDDVGFYAENEIFNNEECITARFSKIEELNLQKGEIRHYYFFSKTHSDKVYFLEVKRGEELHRDKRPYKHMELFKIKYLQKPQYSYTAAIIMKEACQRNRNISANEDDLIKAMGFIASYIPDRMKERMIFSFDDTKSQSVIRVKPGITMNVDRNFDVYCQNPELYFPGFNAVMQEYYSKGGYGGDELKQFIGYMDSELKKQKEKKTQKITEEIKKSLNDPLLGYDVPNNSSERKSNHRESKRGDSILSTTSKVNLGKQTDLTIEDVDSHSIDWDRVKQRPTFYPIDMNWMENKLFAVALINYGFKYKNLKLNSEVWSQAYYKEILALIKNIKKYSSDPKDRQNFFSWLEPSDGCSKKDIFYSIKNYLGESNDDVGIALSLFCFFDNGFSYKETDFTNRGLNPIDELMDFYRTEKLDSTAIRNLMRKMKRAKIKLIDRIKISIRLSFSRGKK